MPSAPQKRACAKGRSFETHTTTVFSRPAASSLNLRTLIAQVPVSSEGKMFSTTRLPARSALLTGARSWPTSSKAGSAEPFAGSSPTVVTGLVWNEMDAMPPIFILRAEGHKLGPRNRPRGQSVLARSRSICSSASKSASGRCGSMSSSESRVSRASPARRGRGFDSAGRSAERHGMTLTAITHAHVVPIEGDPFDGTVLVRDGRLTALGPELEIPDGAEVVDAAGGWLLPGFVDAHVHLGVAEEGEGWAGEDTNEMTEPVMAAARAIDAINPVEVGFDDAIIGGITAVNVNPGSGNPIG